MKTLLIIATLSLSGCAAVTGWIGMHGTVIAEVTAGAAAMNQAESLYLNTKAIEKDVKQK